jgi:hypothetical protein
VIRSLLSIVFAVTLATTADARSADLLDIAHVQSALSPKQRIVAAEYRKCLREEMSAGASFENAGEGCAGVWTTSHDALERRVAIKFPKLSRARVRDSVTHYLDHANDDLKKQKSYAPNQ